MTEFVHSANPYPDRQHLSKTERAALIAYLELRQSIEPNEDLNAEIGALVGGYPGYYPECLVDTEFLDEELPESTIEYVLHALEVYDWIQRTVRSYSLAPTRPDVCLGFDGNGFRSPPRAHGFALYVTKVMNLFDVEFASPDLNSHGSEGDYAAKYRLMQNKREIVNNPERDLDRTVELINQLLAL